MIDEKTNTISVSTTTIETIPFSNMPGEEPSQDVHQATGSLKNYPRGNKQRKNINCDDWKEKKWSQRYEELVIFQRQNGHCLVPGNINSLWRWVKTQRVNNERNIIRKDRKDLLDQLGFVWNGRSYHEDKQWYRHYEQLVAFQRNHGHFNVTVMKEEDKSLVTWVRNLRSRPTNNNLLRQDRKDLLDKLGFIWESRSWHDDSISWDQKWNQQYRKLVDFHRQNGHCSVPCSYKEDKSLGRWVSKQRRSPIRRDRKVLLDQLGFVFLRSVETRPHEAALPPAVIFPLSWDFMFVQLEQFKQTHGHVNIALSSNNAHDLRLAVWVKAQQEKARDGLVERRRVKRLVEIGIPIGQDDVCASKQNADAVMAHEKKDPIAKLEEYREMASEEEHQEQQVVYQGLLSSSPQEALPLVMVALPLNLSAGVEYSLIFEPCSSTPLGLDLQPAVMGNGCRVVSIQHGGQAWQSGNIKVGDIVSKIHGQTLSDFCYDAIMYLLLRELRQEVTFFRPH
jgi:hypothetical protein